MNLKKRFLRLPHLFFIILLLIQFLPDKTSEETYGFYFVSFIIFIEIISVIISSVIKSEKKLEVIEDLIGFLYLFFTGWSLLTAKSGILNTTFFPPMGKVVWQFTQDLDKSGVNIMSSLKIIFQGYLLAAVTALPLGLFLGCSKRLGNAGTYIAKFLGSVPPIVYIPYGIVLLPTFHSVSVFVIFLASFWPVFSGTLSGVMNIDKRIIESAETLKVTKTEMLFNILFPAALPQIFQGCSQGLGISFILLTSAEMIEAKEGIGYYIKQYSDFGDYTRALVGIFLISVLVIAISYLFGKLQNHLLAWKEK